MAMHVIVGEDDFLVERVRDIIIQRTEGNPTVESHHCAELTGSMVYGLVTPTLMREARVIVFAHGELARKEVMEAFIAVSADPVEEITIILMHSGGGKQKKLLTQLKKTTQVNEVKPVKPRDRMRWVMDEFRSHNARVTPDVAQAVLEGVGSDLRELAAAIAQLVSDNNGNVTVDSVRTMYQGVAEVSGFEIADLIVSGQTAKAVASTRRALQLGEPPVRLTSAIASNITAIACLYSMRGTGVQVPGMPPWKADKLAKVARRWSEDSIARAVVILAELEEATKGWGNPEYSVEFAVRRLSELARQ